MKPLNLKSKIFLDSGDPKETRATLELLGFLDGQTTNPSLVAKNPLAMGKQFNSSEILGFYKNVVSEVSALIPQGSVSIEVYADHNTTAREMLEQGREFATWIPNAHIKFPITAQGILAATSAVKEGMRINMTLCFSQSQAAAVYTATRGAVKGQVFLSPFVGRLDDQGENGMDLIRNILRMYKSGDGHVQVLSASIRHLDHFFESINMGSDILTVPYQILKDWREKSMLLPDPKYIYPMQALRPIPYEFLDINSDWESFNIQHALTDKGLEKFSGDWNALIKE